MCVGKKKLFHAKYIIQRRYPLKLRYSPKDLSSIKKMYFSEGQKCAILVLQICKI